MSSPGVAVTGSAVPYCVGQSVHALTTAIIDPGTSFGEMVLGGQQMYDNQAQALRPSETTA